VRIIGGTHKGLRLNPPPDLSVRPTTDRAKEGLFNILMSKFAVDGAMVLDLFAGTGNISYEFASRGCKKVVSVDNNFRCIRFIKSVVKDLNLTSIAPVRADCFKYLRRCTDRFNVVFADPPYKTAETPLILDLLISRGLVTHGGWIILEHSSGEEFSKYAHFADKRSYGNVKFSIFRL